MSNVVEMKEFVIRVHHQGTVYEMTVQAETEEQAREIARDELYKKYVTDNENQH